jgi:hypothetical protein
MATLGQEMAVRTGLIPMSYDMERRMITYYWFMAVPGSEKVSGCATQKKNHSPLWKSMQQNSRAPAKAFCSALLALGTT